MESDAFKEICDQIHDIRNFLSPLDLKLASLYEQVNEGRALFNSKSSEFETKINATNHRVNEHAVRIDEHAALIAEQSERIKRLELLLQKEQHTEITTQAPVREDKLNPAILPPQTPPA